MDSSGKICSHRQNVSRCVGAKRLFLLDKSPLKFFEILSGLPKRNMKERISIMCIISAKTITHHYAILFVIFIIVFTGHFSCKLVTSSDSKWTVFIAMSLIKEGDIDLDEYEDIANNHYAIYRMDGHYYSVYPIGVPLMSVPFVYVIDKSRTILFSLFPSYEKRVRKREQKTTGELEVTDFYRDVELFIASILIAITSVLMYLTGRCFLNKKYSFLSALIFAFCTSAWSTGSRALWQHGPTMLMLSITLYILLRAKEKPSLIQFASIPLMFSCVIRPTNILSLVFIAIYVFFQYRHYILKFFLWSLPIAIPFFFFNVSLYHTLLPGYYLPNRIGGSSRFFEALVGNLISPARGLFVFSPVLLLSLWGIVVKIRRRQFEKLDFTLLGIIILHWIVISSHPNWWGGWSIGPRYFSEMTPYFIYFLLPVLATIPGLKGFKKVCMVSFLCILMFLSGFIHYKSSRHVAVWHWNKKPVNIDDNPERLWDWKDLQFLRGKQK